MKRKAAGQHAQQHNVNSSSQQGVRAASEGLALPPKSRRYGACAGMAPLMPLHFTSEHPVK